MGWIMLVILLGLLALIVWHHEETKRREREAAAEANRRGQVFAFVRTLGTAFPPGVIPSLPSPSEPPAGGSWNLTERLLDDLDAVTGPVIGTVATHPRCHGRSWQPGMRNAALHRSGRSVRPPCRASSPTRCGRGASRCSVGPDPARRFSCET